jgi:DNA mismatch repair protein MutL
MWGFVSPLAVSFPTRRYLHVAVNGRVVDTDSFAPAISKAYADLLPKGRHPAAFLRLELGPGEVDVNVHSAKSAVRLRGGRSAYPLVAGAIRAALAPEKEVGGGAPPEGQDVELTPIGQFAGRCKGRRGSKRQVDLDDTASLLVRGKISVASCHLPGRRGSA